MKTSDHRRCGAAADRHAFSLIEVMVAMTVSIGIMMTIVSHLWYASEVWRRGQQKISLQNQMRMVHDVLTREMTRTLNLGQPNVGQTTATLTYKITIASTSPAVEGVGSFHICLDQSPLAPPNGTGSALVRLIHGWDAPVAALFADATFRSRQTFTIARDVTIASFTRTSKWTVDAYIRVESDSHRGDDAATDENLFYEATTTYLIPGEP